MATPLSSANVAAQLGISPSQVRRHAAAHSIGTRIDQRTRIFSQGDVSQLRKFVGTVGTYKRKGRSTGGYIIARDGNPRNLEIDNLVLVEELPD